MSNPAHVRITQIARDTLQFRVRGLTERQIAAWCDSIERDESVRRFIARQIPASESNEESN